MFITSAIFQREANSAELLIQNNRLIWIKTIPVHFNLKTQSIWLGNTLIGQSLIRRDRPTLEKLSFTSGKKDIRIAK